MERNESRGAWLVAVLMICGGVLSGGCRGGEEAADIAVNVESYEPAGLNLTWQRDPATTMTVDWHVLPGEDRPVIEYREQGSVEWRARPGEASAFPFSDRSIMRAELTGLEPDARYEFRFGDESRQYQFRTMPRTADRPIRFAAGGDVRHERAMMERTGRVAVAYDPDFIVFGGDLAYANADPRRIDRWYEWFEVTRDTFVAPDGRIIPVVVAIGNHEVFAGSRMASDGLPADYGETEWGLRDGDAPFCQLFAMPRERTYDVLDFGDYLSLILLDTDHVAPVAGEQTAWLAAVLADRSDMPHLIPVYHVPGYPSVRTFRGATSRAVREHWVPLFELYGVRVAFENHDHAYKRTHPLRDNNVDPDGIIYLGDGAWGVSTRPIGRDHEPGEGWYLERAEPYRHVIIVTLDGASLEAVAVDENGEVFDGITLPEPAAAEASRSPS